MRWYDELRRWARQGFAGPHPIVWADADAWARQTETKVRSAEWTLLQQIDARFMNAAIAAQPKKPERPGASA